ncbi:MAG: type IV pilin protein [Coriobacteriia bacterium]
MKQTQDAMTHDDGFTMMELMVIVLIIGILVAVAVASYVPATRSAAASACRYNQRALESAYAQAGDAADAEVLEDIDDLAPYIENIDHIKLCPLDGAPLELDVSTGDVSCPHGEHQ